MDSPLGREFAAFKKKVIVAISIISIGCAIGIWQSRQAGEDAQRAIANSNKDTFIRLDESCTQKERQWTSTVHSIQITYNYLEELSPKQIADPLNQLIIRELPRTYKEAKFNKPISACKEKGIGLDKPIESLPPQRDFSNLLK